MTGVAPQKRSITIAGHRTSLSIEDEFWDEIKKIATKKNCSLAALIEQIDAGRGERNLSSALRVYVLQHLKN